MNWNQKMKNVRNAAVATSMVFGLPVVALAEGGMHSDKSNTQQHQMDRRSDTSVGQDQVIDRQNRPDERAARDAQSGETRARMGSESMNEASPERVDLSQDKIRSLQEELRDVQPDLQVDGVWGENTKQALKKYQRENDIEVTGQPDQQTLASLGIEKEEESKEQM